MADSAGVVIDLEGTPRTQAELDALNAKAAPEPFLSVGSAFLLAAGLVAAAVIAAIALPVAPAALFVLFAGLAVGYAIDAGLSAAWSAVKTYAPEVAGPLARAWQAMPVPVQRVLRWTPWLIILLILAMALSRWRRGRKTRGPAR